MIRFAWVGVVALSAGCATAHKGAPPASPAGAAPEAPESQGLSGDPDAEAGSEGKKSEQSAPGGFAQPAIASLDEAEARLGEHASRLSGALSTAKDCEVARKALESMKRSRDRICDLNGPEDPGARCAKARARVDAASEDLKRGCGS